MPDDGATAAKKRRQAVARRDYSVASGRGSGHCGSPRRAFTKNATEPALNGRSEREGRSCYDPALRRERGIKAQNKPLKPPP